jgi:hypothetical protein
MLPVLRVVILPVDKVVMLPLRLPVDKVVMLPLRLLLSVVMLPAKAVVDIIVTRTDAHNTDDARLMIFLLVNGTFTGWSGD